ncbi:hypothetical protein N9L77_05365 [Pseudomonadales bacterium]|nr:hypothetical protein [Pseudomonadales bacterium]MDB4567488.1 hypothetical protein [Pseudomonadales bacterium]MDB9876263.1 hypothetical protein [Pseudomonadales bacterium]MDO7572697.1 hypothetical protein [Pseudomonadales bacterium]
MTDKDLTQSRRKLLLVAATAFVPMMIAYGLFFFAPDMIPKTTTNRGELVQPSIDISDRLATEGRWQLLMPMTEPCLPACAEILQGVLHQTRQINIALGKNADRLGRGLVRATPFPPAEGEAMKVDYPNLKLIVDAALLNELTAVSSMSQAAAGYHVFLVDPMGQLILAYPAAKVDKPLLLDLKHLMKVSNIG